MAPANPSVAKGLTDQFTATGTYTDGSTANSPPGDLGVGDGRGRDDYPQAAWPRPWPRARPRSLRRSSGITSPSDTLTVTAAALTSIAVAPANPSVAKGLTDQFTATGTYTDGSTATSPAR